jgi:hypothetical protein
LRAIKEGFRNYIFYYLSYLISNIGSGLVRATDFSTLNGWQWLGIAGIPIPLTYLAIQNKKSERKRIRTELDFQYEVAFKFAGKAVYDLQNVIIADHLDNHEYLKQLLQYLTYTVESILKENDIESDSLSANIMVPEGEGLKILVFGLDLPNRKIIFLPCNNGLPGAPEAYKTKKITYVKDTSQRIHGGLFENPEYKSFFSIPITENDNDGNVFAVINIDSHIKNQFKSYKFISDKIYPALSPIISLMKILYKIDKTYYTIAVKN